MRQKISATKVSLNEIYISRQDDNSEVVMGFLGVYLYKGLLPKTVLIDKPHCGIYMKLQHKMHKQQQ